MDRMVLEGYQPKKKVDRDVKLPKGGFGLEKDKRSSKYGKLSNGATLVKPTDKPAPPPPPAQPKVKLKNGSEIYGLDCNESIRGQSASDIWINHEILCNVCINKDICKYKGDYLEQVVHIIDVYDGVFDLNCNHYRTIKALHVKYDDKLLDEKMTLDIYDQHRKIIQNGLK